MANDAGRGPFLTEAELQRKLRSLGYDDGHPAPPMVVERVRRGLSQKDLGAKLHMRGQMVSKIETGKFLPNELLRQAVADALEVRLEVLRFDDYAQLYRPFPRPQAPITLLSPLELKLRLQEFADAGGDPSHPLTIARIERGWSVEELARRAGVSPATIKNILEGKRRTTERTLAKIAEAMELDPEAITVPRPWLTALQVDARLRSKGLGEDGRPVHPERWAREQREWSARVVAERSGISTRTVQRIERGDTKDPHARTTVAIANTFGVSRARLGFRFRVAPTRRRWVPPPELPEPEPSALLRLRDGLGLSLSQVAGDVGVPASRLESFEEGLELPDAAVLVRLAERYGVTHDEVWPCPEDNPLKAMRERRGMSRRELAYRLNVQESLIWWLEAERRTLQPWLLVPMSTVLGIYPDDLKRPHRRSPLAVVLAQSGMSRPQLLQRSAVTAADLRHLEAAWLYPRSGVVERVAGALRVPGSSVWRGPEQSPFRTWRLLVGMTLEQVASGARLPVAVVDMLERQRRIPSKPVRNRMARALRVRSADVLRELVSGFVEAGGEQPWVYEDDQVVALIPPAPDALRRARRPMRMVMKRERGRPLKRTATHSLAGFRAGFAAGDGAARRSGVPRVVFPSDVVFADGTVGVRGQPPEMAQMDYRYRSRRSVGTDRPFERDRWSFRLGKLGGWYQTKAGLARDDVQGSVAVAWRDPARGTALDRGGHNLLTDAELDALLETLGFDADNPVTPVERERLRRGWSAAELARRSGVSKGTISHIQTRKARGTVRTLRALAEAMQLPLEALLPKLSETALRDRLEQLGFSAENPPHVVAEVRTQWQLTRLELAELSDVSVQTVARIENREGIPDAASNFLVAEALGLLAEEVRLGVRLRPRPAEASSAEPAHRRAGGTRVLPHVHLQNLRTERHMSVADLAEAAGMAAEVLVAVEAGEELPDADQLYALADVLGMPADEVWLCPADNRLMKHRERLGLSRAEFAERVGGDETLLWHLEAELLPLQPWMLVPLSTELGVYPDDLRRESERSPLGVALRRAWMTAAELAGSEGLNASDVRHLQAQWHYPAPGVVDQAAALLDVAAEDVWHGPQVSPFRTRRARLGLSAGDVADQAGLPLEVVEALERERRLPSALVLQRMAFALQMPEDGAAQLRREILPELTDAAGRHIRIYEDDKVVALVPVVPPSLRREGRAGRPDIASTASLTGFAGAVALGSAAAYRRGAPRVFPSDVRAASVQDPGLPGSGPQAGTAKPGGSESGLADGWYRTQAHLGKRAAQELGLGKQDGC